MQQRQQQQQNFQQQNGLRPNSMGNDYNGYNDRPLFGEQYYNRDGSSEDFREASRFSETRPRSNLGGGDYNSGGSPSFGSYSDDSQFREKRLQRYRSEDFRNGSGRGPRGSSFTPREREQRQRDLDFETGREMKDDFYQNEVLRTGGRSNNYYDDRRGDSFNRRNPLGNNMASIRGDSFGKRNPNIYENRGGNNMARGSTYENSQNNNSVRGGYGPNRDFRQGNENAYDDRYQGNNLSNGGYGPNQSRSGSDNGSFGNQQDRAFGNQRGDSGSFNNRGGGYNDSSGGDMRSGGQGGYNENMRGGGGYNDSGFDNRRDQGDFKRDNNYSNNDRNQGGRVDNRGSYDNFDRRDDNRYDDRRDDNRYDNGNNQQGRYDNGNNQQGRYDDQGRNNGNNDNYNNGGRYDGYDKPENAWDKLRNVIGL